MPELPEVETTMRGIAPYIEQHRVKNTIVRNANLRWPIDNDLPGRLFRRKLQRVSRRGKYLLLHFNHGTVLLHLGMSGSLRITSPNDPIKTHDHVDIIFTHDKILRFHDPRRFGSLIWTPEDPSHHKLLRHLGPEPLSTDFSGEYLYEKSRKTQRPIKTWIMDSTIVVGVGNIYANESLFNAQILPLKRANKISQKSFNILADEIKAVLRYAIKRGGTTLRDFVGGDGKPGYFAQELSVYGRGGHPCPRCGKSLIEKRLSQRSTVYCAACQN